MLDIKDAALTELIAGMEHPVLADNQLFKQLFFALRLEQSGRETGDTTRKPVELPRLEALADDGLRVASVFVLGLCCTIDIDRTHRTFCFCWGLLRVLLEEFALRVPQGRDNTLKAVLQLEALASTAVVYAFAARNASGSLGGAAARRTDRAAAAPASTARGKRPARADYFIGVACARKPLRAPSHTFLGEMTMVMR